MALDHLENPLEYLYEELPPEDMAAAREHLAVCPECRDTVRAIRDTVKVYRDAPRPQPPHSLARRAAEAALEAAAMPPAAKLMLDETRVSGSMPSETGVDGDGSHELAGGRFRRWFFHPGWAVAASVFFICSLLIHVSPRNSATAYQRPAVVGEAVGRRGAEETPAWESLPEAPERQSIQVHRVPAMPVDAGLAPRQAAPGQPAEAHSAAAGHQLEMRSASPLPEPPQNSKLRPALSKTARAESAPSPLTAASDMEDSMAVVEPDTIGDTSGQVDYGAAVSEFVWPEQDTEKLESSPAMPPVAAAVEAVPYDAVISGISNAPLSGIFPSKEMSGDDISDSDGDGGANAIPSPVIVDLQQWEPPQIVPRPTPIDVEKLKRELTILAGLQIGHAEYDDARITIGRLRIFDSEAADELSGMVEQAESSRDGATPTRGMVSSETDENKSAAAISTTEQASAEPNVTTETLRGRESGEADKYFRPPIERLESDAPLESEEISTPKEPVGLQVIDTIDDPIMTEPDDLGEPVAGDAGNGPPFFPEVEKSSSNAFPPTLWEQSGHDRLPRAAGRNWTPSRRRPLFTTDPYWRD